MLITSGNLFQFYTLFSILSVMLMQIVGWTPKIQNMIYCNNGNLSDDGISNSIVLLGKDSLTVFRQVYFSRFKQAGKWSRYQSK